MVVYADTSFLVAVYSPQADSVQALAWMQRTREPLPFTPLHRHELRNALRLRVFRKEMTEGERGAALNEVDADLEDGILVHRPLAWTDVLREAERLGAAYTEAIGCRSLDLLHVAAAVVLGSGELLTFDTRQGELARLAGLRARFGK